MMPYEFHFTRRVEFSETDMAGIMHFANFFRFMEAAETAFMRSLGLSVVLQKSGLNLCLPRVHAECDYAAPLQFEDEVMVRLLVEKKGTRSLTYQFRFYRLNQSQEIARGRITLVCAECLPDGGLKGAPFPKELAEKLQEAPAAILAERFSAGPPKAPAVATSIPHPDHKQHGKTTNPS